ncbi:hypothetical protein Nepgr_026529 [Nepenthes gracilis]|uniref:Uncharacterized protein n=1 Tax=Nepenthes gracilis TaxID=150966 RepID=A0AAD3T8Q8_NEPGR|nr:hypothetical protein Nepgr_026529 [Nepenthes gracilis]
MTVPQHASNWPVAELDGEPVAELEEEPVAELDGEPVVELNGGHADLPVAELDGELVAELDVEQLYSPLDLEAPQGTVHEVLNPATCLLGKNFNLPARSPNDLAMMVGRTSDWGSSVMRKEFHSIH